MTPQLLDHRVANISYNRHKPRLAIAAAKAGEGFVSAHISFLHGVFGILVVTQEPAGEIIGGIEMRQEDLFKVPLVSSCIAMLLHRVTTKFVPLLFPENSFLFME